MGIPTASKELYLCQIADYNKKAYVQSVSLKDHLRDLTVRLRSAMSQQIILTEFYRLVCRDADDSSNLIG